MRLRAELDPAEFDASPFAASMYPNIDEFTEHGQIVIGRIKPVGAVAIASERRQTIAMLHRRKDETFKRLEWHSRSNLIRTSGSLMFLIPSFPIQHFASLKRRVYNAGLHRQNGICNQKQPSG